MLIVIQLLYNTGCSVDEPVGEVEGEERTWKENARQFVDGGRVFDGSWCVYGRYHGHQLKRQTPVNGLLLLAHV